MINITTYTIKQYNITNKVNITTTKKNMLIKHNSLIKYDITL